MDLLHTEGVVLQSLAFKEYDHILTLFTPHGIQKLFAKKSRTALPLLAPLTVGEFVYKPGKNDLHRLQDGSLIDQNLQLRDSLETLVAAEKMVVAILHSQMPGKGSFALYHLFRAFLIALNSEHSETLCTAFYLKVMKHEGILQLQSDVFFRFAGECYSKEEAPLQSQEFSLEEEHLLRKLAQSRKLEELISLSPTKEFSEKVGLLFMQAFSKTQM